MSDEFFDLAKSYEATIDDVDVGKREVVAIISSDTPDREKDVLLAKGLRRKNYQGVTVDFNHSKDHPIGTCKWVKAEPNRIISKYRVSDATQFSRDVFGLLQDGTLRWHSVDGRGFKASAPTSAEVTLNKSWGGAKRVVRDWELLNFCVCTVPVNTDAETLMVSKGISTETIGILKAMTAPQGIEIIAPVVELTARKATGDEVLVALCKAMRTGDISAAGIVRLALARAAGRVD